MLALLLVAAASRSEPKTGVTLDELVLVRRDMSVECLGSDDDPPFVAGGVIEPVRVPQYDFVELEVEAWWTPGYTGPPSVLDGECVLWAERPSWRDLAQYDPLFSRQWHHDHVQTLQAWQLEQGDASVRVAVVDTGLNAAHQDSNTACGPHDFACVDPQARIHYDGVTDRWLRASELTTDPYGHGTFVSGVIAAPINGLGGVGVAPGVRVLSFRGCQTTRCNDVHIARAIIASWDRADVINMSFGASTDSSLIRDALEEAVLTYEMVAVASAGNFGPSMQTMYPAGYDVVIGVGGTDQGDRLWGSSQRAAVELVAPAVDIVGNRAAGGYAESSGTSFSAPMVSAAAALLRTRRPDSTVDEIRMWLRQGADARPGCGEPPNERLCGYGRLNVRAALDLAGPRTRPSPTNIPDPTTSTPAHTDLTPTSTTAPQTATPTLLPEVVQTLTAMAPSPTAPTVRPTDTPKLGTSTPTPPATSTSPPETATEIAIRTQVAATLTALAPTETPDVRGTVDAVLTEQATPPNAATRVAATVTAVARTRTLYLPALLALRPPPPPTETPLPWFIATRTAEARPTATPTFTPRARPWPTVEWR